MDGALQTMGENRRLYLTNLHVMVATHICQNLMGLSLRPGAPSLLR